MDSLSQTFGLPAPSGREPFGWCCHKPALKGEVDMSVSEWTEGLKKKVVSLGIINPSVNPPYGVLPAPRKGEPFGASYKLLYNFGGPPMTAPTPHLINFCQKQGDGSPSPHHHNLFRSPAFGGFHMAEPYFTAHQRNFTLRKQDFTARGSALSLPSTPS